MDSYNKSENKSSSSALDDLRNGKGSYSQEGKSDLGQENSYASDPIWSKDNEGSFTEDFKQNFEEQPITSVFMK